MIDLTPYSSIKSALLVRIDVKKYKVNPGDTASNTIITFSDLINPITVTLNGVQETYEGRGEIIDLSSSISEIRSSSNEVTITLSSVWQSTVSTILNSSMKGSRISIFRVLLDPITHQPLPIAGNPMGRFFGIINNYGIDEQWGTNQTTNTVSLVCKSSIDVLSSSVKGRRTNPYDQKLYFPADISMDRVTSLTGSNYNFGELP